MLTGKEEQDTDLLMSEQQHILISKGQPVAVKGCTSADASHLWPGQKGEF